MIRLGFAAASALAAALACSPAASAAIPESKAFRLPSVTRCVSERNLALNLRELDKGTWASVTANAGGKQVLDAQQPSTERAFRVRGLPTKAFTLVVRASTSDRQTAKATRRYHPCAPGGKPTVTIPEGAAPTELVTRDLVKGTGARARVGQRVSVRYVGVAWSTRETFDSSYSRGDTFTFPLGDGAVIKGWDEGLVGMRVGGRRELSLPPAFGYGAVGAPPAIAPNETLVFVVDLIEIR